MWLTIPAIGGSCFFCIFGIPAFTERIDAQGISIPPELSSMLSTIPSLGYLIIVALIVCALVSFAMYYFSAEEPKKTVETKDTKEKKE